MEQDFILLDLETTGLDPVSDKIIEIGLVRLKKGIITETFHSLINPNRPLPLKIKRLTGLNDLDLAGAPSFLQVYRDVLDFISIHPIAGHNIRFDLGFLETALGSRVPNNSYDTLELARIVVPSATNHRLNTLCTTLNVGFKATHRALDDALANARLLTVLIQELQNIDFKVLVTINELLKKAHSNWHLFTTELIKNYLKKIPEQSIAPAPYWKRKNKKSGRNHHAHTSKRKKLPLKATDVTAVIEKEGPLASFLPGYEYRPQQKVMIENITQAFNEGKYLIMEAGTGAGKSMSYLIPSIFWSLFKGEKVLVATHTINLQDQLWLKDIPILLKTINKPFKAALAKGRQNYICLRKWFLALEGAHKPEEAVFFARILIWLTITVNGDKSELNINSTEEDFWFSICGEAEGCLGRNCHFQEDCFVHKAKKEAEEADLIITNHSLLFSDVKAENRVLPAYGPLIIDEAHHLEESATTHLGRKVSRSAIRRLLTIAGKVLSKLGGKAPPDSGVKWNKLITAAQAKRLEAIEALRLFSQAIYEMTADKLSIANDGYARFSIRLPCYNNHKYDDFLAGSQNVIDLLLNFVEDINACIELMELWAISEEAWTGLARDLVQISQTSMTIIEDIRFITSSRDDNFVYWLELEAYTRKPVGNFSLMSTPVSIGNLLYKQLFNNKNTVILSSATLSVNGSFDYFMERTGLNNIKDERIIRKYFDSPFAYDRQVLLCINKNVPIQGTVPDNVYLRHLENSIYKLLETTRGKTLILFTSHRTLREIYSRLKPKLEALDLYLLGHGLDGSRSKILEEFKSTDKTVLFGASSFWEGVDVPGNALTFVVIVKLPFASPSTPVMEARLEHMAKQNKDGFRYISIPQAVIRFKQGFGRLIRNSGDHGCVIILDGRILSKSYGKQFINSLPLKSYISGNNDTISTSITNWMSNYMEKY